MSINSRAKGARAERQFAQYLNETFPGLGAHRGAQFQGGPDSPDVAKGIPGTHPEVKHVEKLNVYEAMEQAVRDAGEGDVPYVAHRRNRTGWLVTVRADDLVRFAECVVGAKVKYPKVTSN